MLLIVNFLLSVQTTFLIPMATHSLVSDTVLPNKAELRIEIAGIEKPNGQVLVALYDRKTAFLDPQKAHSLKVLPIENKGGLSLSLGALPVGEYAFACFHDLNNNGKLDKNLLGVPTEPYGFSNNARPKFRAPSWEEAKFALPQGGQVVTLRLERW